MKNQSLSLLEKLQDNNYALYFAIFTCIAIAPNSYYMFHAFSIIPEAYLSREIQAAAIALIIAGSILYYTAKKNLDYAQKFAYFEFFISCCYYIESLLMTDSETHLPAELHWNWHIIPAFGFAYMLPWSVKGYAASIDYDQIKKNVVEAVTQPIDKLLSEEQINKMIWDRIASERAATELKQKQQPDLSEQSTEQLLEQIDETEEAFNKGSISAIK